MALLVSLVGCAAPVAPVDVTPAPPAAPAAAPAPQYLPMAYEVGLDPSLAPSDVDGVKASLSAWTSAVGVQFSARPADCHGTDVPAICVYLGPLNVVVADDGISVKELSSQWGECFEKGGLGGLIELNAQEAVLGPDMFKSLVMHEVGHAMGLQHPAGAEDAVMNAAIQIESAPTELDVAQFWAVHSRPAGATATVQQ